MESEETTLGDQDGDSSSWMDLPLINDSSSRGDKKKRFSEDQIKSLESMFQTQTKLDPRQKLQLAKELNLEPRQVAIWFQNKRARWKSKKLEREYSALKSEYENLLSSFENLKKEKQMLLKQMQRLAKMLENKDGDQTTPTPNINDSFTPPCSSEDKNLMYLSDQDEQDLYTWQRSRGDEVQMQYAVDPLCGSTLVQSQWWDFWPIKE